MDNIKESIPNVNEGNIGQRLSFASAVRMVTIGNDVHIDTIFGTHWFKVQQ